jgi:DNA polymerase III subunit epsilon
MRAFRRRRELNVHWRKCSFLVVDVETTGLDLARDSIISYGAVPVTGGRVIGPEAVYGLVRPDHALSPASIQIHTLREADLQDAPPQKTAMERMSGLLSGRILVAHAAWVEESFLRRGFEQIGIRSMPPVIDTAALARAEELVPRSSGGEPDLEWLCMKLGLPVMDPHHALGDAMTTAGLFIALASKLDTSGELTGRALLKLSEGNTSVPYLPFFR